MMMPHKLRLLGVSALLCFAAPLSAQESLMDIYQRALQNDPMIREAEARYLANVEVRPQARAQLLPQLQFSSRISGSFQEQSNVINPVTGTLEAGQEQESDSRNWQLSVNQAIFDWSRILTLKQSEKRVAQAEIEYEVAKQQLLLRVAEAYFNVLAAEDSLEAQVVARQAFERQLEQAQRRFEVGLIARTDVEETQAAFDRSVAAEIEAQRLLATAQEQLREIIGEYVVDLASPGDDLPLVPPDPQDPDQWVRAALEQNLALIAARLQAEIAQDDVRLARADRLPRLTLSSSYNSDEGDGETRVAGVPTPRPFSREVEGYNWSINLTVPLFTGGLNSSRIQQSVYNHRASVQAVERVARETERATRDAYLGVMSSISQVRALRQAVASAQTALEATEAGYEVGTRTSVEVQTSLEALTRAQTDYAAARYNYILNRLRLMQAAGTLAVSDIELVDGWLGR